MLDQRQKHWPNIMHSQVGIILHVVNFPDPRIDSASHQDQE